MVSSSYKIIASLASILVIPALIVIWEFAGVFGLYDTNVIPYPSDVFNSAVGMFQSGEMVADVLISLKRWVIGFVYAMLLGVFLGILTARQTLFRIIFQPVIQFFRPIPAISFVPIAIVWFGIGEQAKHFLVMWGAFFPIWLNTHLGISTVNKKYIWAAKSLGASDIRIVTTVVLPAALPFILAGLRIGISVGFICLVAAEMAGAYEGLGFRITASHLVFRIDKMFVALILLGALGALSDKLFASAVEILFPWARQMRQKEI